MAKAREQEQQKLQSLIVEKLMQYERLKLEHEALLKTEAQQHEFMEQFMLQKWYLEKLIFFVEKYLLQYTENITVVY